MWAYVCRILPRLNLTMRIGVPFYLDMECGLPYSFAVMESFQDRFIKAIAGKIPNSKCPLCQSSDWAVQPGVFRFRQGQKNEFGGLYYGDALPSAALVCNICGNTQFVNVLAYGDQFKNDI
jgi:hypothetical protein